MFNKFKIWISEKSSSTVFGDAYKGITSLYAKNQVAFGIEMLIAYIVSMFLTGAILTLFLNLTEGGGYPFSLYNLFALYINHGIVASLFIFFFVQIIIFKYIRIFSTGRKRDMEQNMDISEEGTYGTAGKMDRKEMAETFIISPIKENKATIFGRDPQNPNNLVAQKHPLLKINRNTFMVAGPSAGKSATFVIPLIMQILRRGESAIVSDPKSELFKYLSELAKKLGYEVRILNLNPMFLQNSDPCNFMMYVGEDPDKAQVMSNAIIKNTTGGDEIFNFWTEGPLNLLQALILRINIGNDYLPEEKNLPQIFTYLKSHDLEEMEMDFENLSETHPAKAPFKIFKDGDDKVKKQVVQGLAIKLKLFNSPLLTKILSKTEGNMDVLNPGRKKCLYFIGSNDQDDSMSAMVSLFYTLLYQELVRYADMRTDGQLPVAVHMVLDEYANMSTIPSFEKKLSTVRSRNIVTYIICQDINQLKTKHPGETWKTVLNDCDYFLMLKTNDPDTMKWWSEMSGEQTVTVTNKRYKKSKVSLFNLHVEEDASEGQGKRATYTTDEVRRLKNDEVLVLVSQRKILKLKTFFYKDHPYSKYIKEVLPVQHYPFWRLIEDGVVGPDFDYDKEPSYIIEIQKDEKMEIDEDYDPDEMLGVFNNRLTPKKLNKLIPQRFIKKEDVPIKEETSQELIQVKTVKLNKTKEEILIKKEHVSSNKEKKLPPKPTNNVQCEHPKHKEISPSLANSFVNSNMDFFSDDSSSSALNDAEDL